MSKVSFISSSSCSTARSHKETIPSALEAANVDRSLGCHSKEVIGPLCQWKEAIGAGVGVEVLSSRSVRIEGKKNTAKN